VAELIALRQQPDLKVNRKRQSRQLRRFHLNNPKKRMVRLFYFQAPFMSTTFVRFMDKYLDDTFGEFFSQKRQVSDQVSKAESVQQDGTMNNTQDS